MSRSERRDPSRLRPPRGLVGCAARTFVRSRSAEPSAIKVGGRGNHCRVELRGGGESAGAPAVAPAPCAPASPSANPVGAALFTVASHTRQPVSGRTSCAALACAAAASLALVPAAAAAPESITLDESARSLTYGDELVISGEVSPGREGDGVRLKYKPSGGSYDVVDETTTDRDGDYRFKLVPEHSGKLKAAATSHSGEETATSEPASIEVDARLKARAREHWLRGDPVTVHGRLRPGLGGREVVIQRRRRGDWKSVSSARTGGDGSYSADWSAGIGSYRLRARFRGDDLNGRAGAELDDRVNVYRSRTASWYGPGLYGNTTACGQRLKPSTVGVAHKTLPCGTKVRFYYRGRTAKVPVIDRGPFVAGREWDLTEAAKNDLRFPDLDEIWSTR